MVPVHKQTHKYPIVFSSSKFENPWNDQTAVSKYQFVRISSEDIFEIEVSEAGRFRESYEIAAEETNVGGMIS